MKKIICLFLSVVLCFSLSTVAFAAGTCTNKHSMFLGIGHCNANTVNVRTGPGTDYTSNGKLSDGDVLNWFETMDEATGKLNQDMVWRHVHGDHIGWMHGDYFTLDEPARSAAFTILEHT